MAFQSINTILEIAEKEGKEFWKIILEDDCHERECTEQDSFEKMRGLWNAMLLAAENYEGNLMSASGLIGGAGKKMVDYAKKQDSLSGTFMTQVIAGALQMGESNACMKRIVAAPTAGSCGVLPAVLVPLYKEQQLLEELIIKAFYVAAGIGQVIAARAFIAGASGGCQAEIGSASAMAAGALVFLKGGNNEQIEAAAAMALKNLLGLVCDPVAGLVEVPCVKRNVIGAVNAVACADMALAGIKSAIPADQVFDAMKEIGELMPESLRETGTGGLAATETGQKIKQNQTVIY